MNGVELSIGGGCGGAQSLNCGVSTLTRDIAPFSRRLPGSFTRYALFFSKSPLFFSVQTRQVNCDCILYYNLLLPITFLCHCLHHSWLRISALFFFPPLV